MVQRRRLLVASLTCHHPLPPPHTQVLIEMVERHQRARAAVTDDVVDAFMAARPMPWNALYG